MANFLFCRLDPFHVWSKPARSLQTWVWNTCSTMPRWNIFRASMGFVGQPPEIWNPIAITWSAIIFPSIDSHFLRLSQTQFLGFYVQDVSAASLGWHIEGSRRGSNPISFLMTRLLAGWQNWVAGWQILLRSTGKLSHFHGGVDGIHCWSDQILTDIDRCTLICAMVKSIGLWSINLFFFSIGPNFSRVSVLLVKQCRFPSPQPDAFGGHLILEFCQNQ